MRMRHDDGFSEMFTERLSRKAMVFGILEKRVGETVPALTVSVNYA